MELVKFLKRIGERLHLLVKKEPKLPVGHYRIASSSTALDSIIGNYTYIAPDTRIQSAIIGKFCSIGPNNVIGYGEHPIKYLSTSPMFYHTGNIFGKTFADDEKFERYQQITIGNDVWVGANVYIKNAVVIGDGSVIAAGAVVVKDVPPYAIVGGVPAKIIKYRFPEDIIHALLVIKWWEWSDEELKKNQHYFVSEDINVIREFIKNQNKT